MSIVVHAEKNISVSCLRAPTQINNKGLLYEQGSGNRVKNECGHSKIGHFQSCKNQLYMQIIRQMFFFVLGHIHSLT